MTNTANDELIRLTRLNLIPLYVVLTSLVWVLHDYLVTLEDEVKYMWRQKRSFSKFMFFWIRYYTIFLVAFDVLQIHSFAIPGVVSRGLCIATDPVTRLLGAISLWSIEIIMQLRIYVLFGRSKKIATFNAIVFAISIGLFLWIMIINAMRRKVVIDNIPELPPLGCPSINGGSQWAQWVPAMLFEFVLFGFAAYKSFVSTAARIKLNQRTSLTAILIHENILYFSVVGCLLVFNNLMVVGATRIPWFGFGPFHAALGITTGRMLIHLRKFATKNLEGNAAMSLPEMNFVGAPAVNNVDRPRRDIETNYEESDSDLDSVSDLSHDTENAAGPSTRFAHT